jgi:hypothetical protein
VTSSTLGKQRADRRNDRNGAGRRFLAALGASVVLGFGVGAPIAAAQTGAPVPRREGGGSNSRSDNGDARLREQVERLSRELVAERHERERRDASPPVGPTVTSPTVPPLNVPVIVPRIALPPVGVPAVAARPSGPVTASATPTASRTGAGFAGAVGRTGVNGTPAGAGAAPAAAPNPPAAAPSTTPRSGVARALRTARSYGALLALAAAVVIFLGVQGRLDRRDPRILSAPAEDHLPFRDFE